MDGRWLAIDWGEKRVGLAVSDPLGLFPVGLPTLTYNNQNQLWEGLSAVFSAYTPVQVIVGLPRNMDGSEGQKAQQVREFTDSLSEKTDCPIHFIDERLSSKQAERTLLAMGKSPSRNKASIDQSAAMILLESALNRRSF